MEWYVWWPWLTSNHIMGLSASAVLLVFCRGLWEITGSKNFKKYARCTFHHIAGKPLSGQILLNLAYENALYKFTFTYFTYIIVCPVFSSNTPKLPFAIDLLHNHYNSVRTAVQHCDKDIRTQCTLLDALQTNSLQTNDSFLWMSSPKYLLFYIHIFLYVNINVHWSTIFKLWYW